MPSLRALPLIAAVVPFVGVTIAYWIASSRGLVPGCVPYIDGCTSISASGRYEPASYLFRAVNMPLAVVHIVTWWLAADWLGALGNQSRRAKAIIRLSGLVAGLSLIVYVTYLGTSGPVYEFMRRFGIYGYFLGTAVAQLTLALAVVRVQARTARFDGYTQGTPLVWLAALPFVLGILNLVLKAVLDDADAWENRIEWIAALVMQLYFLQLWFAWRVTDFRAIIRTDVR